MRTRRVATIAFALLCVACRWTSADEQLLIEFFDQSRVYDRTSLARVATVVFHPIVDGVVHRFEIVARGPERLDAAGVRSRDVTVRASVVSAAGRTSERTLVVTLTHRQNRWMVTGVRAAGAS